MLASGQIVDFYDDQHGDVLRELYRTKSAVHEKVASAYRLSSDELAAIPDGCFALVMRDGDDVMRKFACIDEGNTRLSVDYLMARHPLLPESAVKTAAHNLMVACDWYGLPVPEGLQKLALSIPSLGKLPSPSTMLSVGMRALSAGSALKSAKSGLQKAQQSGGSLLPYEQIKGAELQGTSTMPSSAVPTAAMPKKAVIVKTGGTKSEDPGHLPDNEPKGQLHSSTDYTDARQKERKGLDADHKAYFLPAIDCTGEAPPTQILSKKAQHFALDDRYPIDDVRQVQKAASYFVEYGKFFTPEDRRQYCHNLVKQAATMLVAMPEEVLEYGADGFAPAGELKMALDTRMLLGAPKEILDELFEKRAEIGPEGYVAVLKELDRSTGLEWHYDSHVPDPYCSTYGFDKTATPLEVFGTAVLTEKQLKEFTSNSGLTGSPRKLLIESFGDDFTNEFCKDPVGIYKSMPKEQRLLIARLATDNGVPGPA